MTDIKITIKPHLAQYLNRKYYDHKIKMIVIPKTSDIFTVIVTSFVSKSTDANTRRNKKTEN